MEEELVVGNEGLVGSIGAVRLEKLIRLYDEGCKDGGKQTSLE